MTEDEDEIMDSIYDFYKHYLGEERVTKEKINEFNFTLKSLNDVNVNKIDINFPISYKEAYTVIESMPESSPGPNGLSIKFFKMFFPFFGEYFINILNRLEDELTETFTDTFIKLILKNTNTVKDINGLRPISLTNFEYRILTKIFTNRISIVSGLLIEDNQTCSKFNRRLSDNIVLLRDLIFDAHLNNSDKKKFLYAISVDQQKAFDSLDHKHLMKLIDHLNLGEFVRKKHKKNIHKLEYTNCC